jgi:hypothetical protein
MACGLHHLRGMDSGKRRRAEGREEPSVWWQRQRSCRTGLHTIDKKRKDKKNQRKREEKVGKRKNNPEKGRGKGGEELRRAMPHLPALMKEMGI